jgi:hypothetical protein
MRRRAHEIYPGKNLGVALIGKILSLLLPLITIFRFLHMHESQYNIPEDVDQ